MTTIRTSRTGRRLTVGLVVAGALTVPALATPASAASTPDPAPLTAEQQERVAERARLVCARVDAILQRARQILARIQGDAETVGSLAWLDVRIARATEAGREDVVVVLQNRRAARAAMIPVIERYIERLLQIQQRCDQIEADL